MAPSAVSLSTTELVTTVVAKELGPSPEKAPLDASKLTYAFNKFPKEVPALDDPIRLEQNSTTDHMITVKWTEKAGWDTPALKPYGPLELMPTASVLHYATEAFEGMKAYRGVDGKLRIFRPNLNCARMVKSSMRIACPSFDPDELQKLIMALLSVDGAKWLPDRCSFLYIRPTIIASAAALGVQKPKEATIFIICCLFPSLDKSSGMKLLASKDDMVRAWPGGFGFAKVGANYGPSLLAQSEARERGFHQILWLFGPEGYVTEAGASNFFVVWRNKETNRVELVTAPLGDKIILDGVTRRSILELARTRLVSSPSDHRDDARDLERIDVVERKYTIMEVIEADNEGRLIEAFAAGTAYFVAPVSQIQYKDHDVHVPMTTFNEDKVKSGPYASLLKTWLKNVMYGREEHSWGVVVEERGTH